MKIRDIVKEDSRFFIKRVWGVATTKWPAVSFGRRDLAAALKDKYSFNPEKDFVIYIGTTDKQTEDPMHRGRILSLLSIQPTPIKDTADLVEAKYISRDPEKWKYTLLARSPFYSIIPSNDKGLPIAKEYIPEAYGVINRDAGIVPISQTEALRLLDIEIEATPFLHNPAIQEKFLSLQERNQQQEIDRMASNIKASVQRANTERTGHHPNRFCDEDIKNLLHKQWHKQENKCALCHARLDLSPSNALFKASTDRIDSENKGYIKGNIQITHLGCNFAKNNATLAEWEEFLRMLTSLENKGKISLPF